MLNIIFGIYLVLLGSSWESYLPFLAQVFSGIALLLMITGQGLLWLDYDPVLVCESFVEVLLGLSSQLK